MRNAKIGSRNKILVMWLTKDYKVAHGASPILYCPYLHTGISYIRTNQRTINSYQSGAAVHGRFH